MRITAPTTSGHVGSPYGQRTSRTNPNQTTFHAGLDYTGSRGDPVLAFADGIVETTVRDSDGLNESALESRNGRRGGFNGYGNVVVIRHPELGVWSSYSHLDSISVRPGQVVRGGEQIGTIGNTSNRKFPGMGVHLHFEIRLPTESGSSPFPGPYNRYNVDPARVFEILHTGPTNVVRILAPTASEERVEAAGKAGGTPASSSSTPIVIGTAVAGGAALAYVVRRRRGR